MNYDEMSDEQINEMLKQKRAQAPRVDYSTLSDQQIDQLLNEKRLAESQPAKETGSAPMSALEGFGQAATLGYLPQIQAATEIDPNADIDEQLRARGFKLPEDDYIAKRDENIRRQQAQAESFPVADVTGKVAGAATGMLGPSLIAKGAGLGAKTLITGLSGGAQGALASPDVVEGEEQGLQLEERGQQALGSGLLSAAFPVAGAALKGARSLIKGAPVKLKDLSQKAAFKSAGAMLKDFRKAMDRKSVNRIGQKLLDEDIVKAGDTFDDIASKVKVKVDEKGARIGDIYKMGDEAAIGADIIPLDARQMARQLELKFTNDLSKSIGGKKTLKKLQPFIDDLKESGESANLSDLIERRRELDALVNWSKRGDDLPMVQKKLVEMRNKLNDVAYDRLRTIDKLKGTNLADDLKAANSDFSDFITVQKIAEDRMAREAANRAFSLGDRAAGFSGAVGGAAAGGTGGAIIGAMAMATIGKLARQRGGPVVARMAEKTSEILNRDPSLLGRFSDMLAKAATESPEKFVNTIIKLRASNPDFERRVNRRSRRVKRKQSN